MRYIIISTGEGNFTYTLIAVKEQLLCQFHFIVV